LKLDEKRAKTASGVPTATSGGTAATGAIGGGQGQGGSAVASGAGGAAVDGTDLEKRVTFLYEMLSKLDATCDHVPAIVRRLHSLAKLHEQGFYLFLLSFVTYINVSQNTIIGINQYF
jgi:hypothetical protein